jgi:hypothetical protein
MPNSTIAAPRPASVDRGSPGGYTERPRTLAERLAYLEREARAILRAPGRFDPAAVRWAEDMVASTTLVAGKAAR